MAPLDALLRRRLLSWYRRHRRDLPWRVPASAADGSRPDPYHVLVSEAMLQQTTVAVVKPYFERFIQSVPTIEELAQADEQQILMLWQGLGYYARARNLLKAAQMVVRDHGGRIPADIDALLTLPGIGRYTAGAIASLAYDRPAPILDGNVARVLCRVGAIRGQPHLTPVRRQLWQRAENLVPRRGAGDFNSALMELGALVCVPGRPRCDACPIARHCAALAAGLQDQVPAARKPPPVPTVVRSVLCIERAGRWLIEQRPSRGRWASMWQFTTVPARHVRSAAARIEAELGLRLGPLAKVGVVKHALSHRRYQFHVYRCRSVGTQCRPESGDAARRRWVRLADLAEHPMPRPHVVIAWLIGA